MTTRRSLDAGATRRYAGQAFFVYFATGALHAPHTSQRNTLIATKANSIRVGCAPTINVRATETNGLIPANAELNQATQRNSFLDSQTPDQKKLEARQMETFAGLPSTLTNKLGRLVDALQEMGVLDNTCSFTCWR